MSKIHEDMKVCDILEMDSRLEEVFLAHGMNCLGCPGATTETVKEAAEGHGIDLLKLLEDLNKVVK